ADRGRDPECRGGREAAHVEALADDRARAEEADAGDDLGGDSRRVVDPAALREALEGVRRDEREQRTAHSGEDVRAQTRDRFARFALAHYPSEEDRRQRKAQKYLSV